MTRPDLKRRRRNEPEPEPNVTLDSPEFIAKLVTEYRENTKHALATHAESQRAYTDAARFDQQAADFAAQEQAAIAKIQQAQAELERVRAQRAEVAGYAEKAREYGTAQLEQHESHSKQALAARTVMERFDIPVPEDVEPPAQVPQITAMLAMPDPTPDPRLDGPMERFNEAHDEHQAETGEQAVAS